MLQTVVLVVEDEPLLRLMAVTMVENAGFAPIEAANADQAVRILESRTDIRIVFTDIDMPGSMDGMKLAACIRDRWPPVEIILTSGHVAARDVRALPEKKESEGIPLRARIGFKNRAGREASTEWASRIRRICVHG
jgi:CheY-like chemotaxis protein